MILNSLCTVYYGLSQLYGFNNAVQAWNNNKRRRPLFSLSFELAPPPPPHTAIGQLPFNYHCLLISGWQVEGVAIIADSAVNGGDITNDITKGCLLSFFSFHGPVSYSKKEILYMSISNPMYAFLKQTHFSRPSLKQRNSKVIFASVTCFRHAARQGRPQHPGQTAALLPPLRQGRGAGGTGH
jgi:hypothetical protein